ncbi:glycosyltransferase family 32 protein [Alkalihalobacterium elongatum]|uniref:glycosyltransferase family 32 protein n=1 Tax=Alkalihalobacterium elongatum TaxID=2675466 RepID=UPI001C1FDF79|nr:glycosyltransferase [Alkalihalobacterium elongatum]
MTGIIEIPKIIHYCWFGEKEKPEMVKKCIQSWKIHLPEYEIKEWNEQNFDFHSNTYAREAYEAKKYAFCSDYVRVHVLYHIGGIYLDTDVEVFKSFNDLLHHHSFWGFEQENFIATSTIGAKKGNPLIKIFLNAYQHKNFINEDGETNQLTNVAIISDLLVNKGLKLNGEFQELEGFGTFYPQTYFSPYDYINCRKLVTEKTYAMHHFYKSWLPFNTRLKGNIKLLASKLIGGNNIARIRKLVSKT